MKPTTLILIASLGTSNLGIGATILAPVAASTDMGEDPSTSVENLINQSHLTESYLSLSTDFDDYIARNPTSVYLREGGVEMPWWESSPGVRSGNIDLILGQETMIDGFAIMSSLIARHNGLCHRGPSLMSRALLPNRCWSIFRCTVETHGVQVLLRSKVQDK